MRGAGKVAVVCVATGLVVGMFGVAGGNEIPGAAMDRGSGTPEGWRLNAAEGNRAQWMRTALHVPARYAIRLEAAGRDWAGASTSPVDAVPGSVVRFGAWILCEGPADERDRLYVRFFRGGAFIGQDGPSIVGATGTWRWVTGNVRAPDDADHWDLSLQIRSRAVAWIADPAGVAAPAAGVDPAAGADAELLSPVPEPPAPAADAWRPVEGAVGLPDDADRDGIADRLEAWIGADLEPREGGAPRTSFQTGGGYTPEHDLVTDVVIVARSEEPMLRGWAGRGYEVHSMGGFRAGRGYVEQHPEEAQTDRDGVPLTCGPGSHYMVPTARRREIAADRFVQAAEGGAVAVCPEEPEFFARAGYSPAFRDAWAEAYDRPWAPPHESVATRWDAERLKARMEHGLLETIYRRVEEGHPTVRRYLLAHSPVNYSEWAITFAHAEAIRSLPIDGFIGQVWTGTARASLPIDGEPTERTFEHAFLEYGSVFHLTRGTGIETWFLMDPLEDHPGRTMIDYRANYHRTLAASLMFPEIVRFEVLPWPNRIYGRVEGSFAAEIGTVTRLLEDVANHPECEAERGTEGIAAFVSDTMMWHRGGPDDPGLAAFHGLTVPLVMRGVPVQVAHLDRAHEPGYLDPFRVILLSYDGMKPRGPETHDALAEWVRAGGVLVVFPRGDAFDAAPGWWLEQEDGAPVDDLLRRLAFAADVAEGERPVGHAFGVGAVLVVPGMSPRVFVESAEGARQCRRIVARACERAGVAWTESPWMTMRRGPYLAVGAITGAWEREGRFVDVLAPGLPVQTQARVAPGEGAVFVDLDHVPDGPIPRVLCGSSRVLAIRRGARTLELVVRGPRGVDADLRILAPDEALPPVAEGIDAFGGALPVQVDPPAEGTVRVRYPEVAEGAAIRLRWGDGS